MKNLILAGAASAALLVPAQADAFYLDSELLKGGLARDEQPLVTLDSVAGLNASIGGIALRYHHRLRLDQASPAQRAFYLGTAGLAAFAAQRANSITIGHEGAHFHFAALDGRDQHRFRADDASTIPWLRAWGSAFLTGHVGGVAASGGEPGASTPEGTMRANNAGLNWQSDYAERMHRRGFARQDLSVFSALDYVLNANYWLSYSAADHRKGRAHGQGGDPQDFAEYLAERHGIENALEDMVKWSALSLLLSSANWQSLMALQSYVDDGETGLFTGLLGGRLSWTVLNYGYEDSFSIAAMGSIRSADGSGAWTAGYETSVIGEPWREFQLGGYRQIARTGLETMLTIGEDGMLLELGGDLAVTDKLSLVASAALPVDGATRRGSRLAPQGENVIRFGISYRF